MLARREDARDTINAQRQREAKLHEQVRMAEENEAAMADELKVTDYQPLAAAFNASHDCRLHRFTLPAFVDLNVVVLIEPRDVCISVANSSPWQLGWKLRRCLRRCCESQAGREELRRKTMEAEEIAKEADARAESEAEMRKFSEWKMRAKMQETKKRWNIERNSRDGGTIQVRIPKTSGFWHFGRHECMAHLAAVRLTFWGLWTVPAG